MNLPILYSFRRCPYAMRARMALAISGVTYEHREILLRDKPKEMVTASSKATVPVLVLPNSQVIDESLDVMDWALSQADPESWLDINTTEAAELIAANDGPFKHHLDRYKYTNRYVEEAAVMEEHRAAALKHLERLDQQLQAKGQLLGNRPSKADYAIFPFIRQCANTDRAWFDALPLPALQTWLTEHLAASLFKTIILKHPLWKRDQAPLMLKGGEPLQSEGPDSSLVPSEKRLKRNSVKS